MHLFVILLLTKKERDLWKLIFIRKDECCQPITSYESYHMSRYQLLQTNDAMNKGLIIISWLVCEIYIDYITSKGVVFFNINVEIRHLFHRYPLTCNSWLFSFRSFRAAYTDINGWLRSSLNCFISLYKQFPFLRNFCSSISTLNYSSP